jgi:predicted ATPase with chaperone activity
MSSGESQFFPRKPETIDGLGLSELAVVDAILKVLSMEPDLSGRKISQLLGLDGNLVRGLLGSLKEQKLVVRAAVTAMGDFCYRLSEAGHTGARIAKENSRYSGPLPVPLDAYIESVKVQSIAAGTSPTVESVSNAFSDLIVPKSLIEAIGPAVASGKGLFLYGKPGNGKTSIAERLARIFGNSVYIPYAIAVDEYIIKLYDPIVHKAKEAIPGLDGRWVAIARPVVVVGGELTLDALDIKFNPTMGICEAPFQLKANCGVLVVDDFGRQQMEPAALLNRWIVPLEKRIDFLEMPNGRKLCLPFDPMVVFSTNLDPAALIDEAFLRRIPYKIPVDDPTEEIFLALLKRMADSLEVEATQEDFKYLVQAHYHNTGRAFRYCQPRDLLTLVRDQCRFYGDPQKVTRAAIDRAAGCYFLPISGVY